MKTSYPTLLFAGLVGMSLAFAGCWEASPGGDEDAALPSDAESDTRGGWSMSDDAGAPNRSCLQNCQVPDDCGRESGNWRCEEGICRADFCATDDDCPADEVCERGYCLSEDGPLQNPDCRDDDIECVNGSTCNSDGDCVCTEGDCIDGFSCTPVASPYDG